MNSYLNKEAAIQSEQLRQLASGSEISLIISAILSVTLAYMLWGAIGTTTVSAWLFFSLLITLSRAVLLIAYQRSVRNDNTAPHVWLLRFRLGIILAGAVWGAAGFLLFDPHDPSHQMLLIFMGAGVTTGGFISFVFDLRSAVIFSTLVIVSPMMRLFIAGGSLPSTMGIALMLYLAFMIVSLKRMNRSLLENIALHQDAAIREEALKASGLKYQLLFESSRDALMVLAPPLWKFTGANQATLSWHSVKALTLQKMEG